MNVGRPRRIAALGAALIALSGVLNAALGLKIGAILYDPYPGGKMGHVGVIAGLAAIVIGLVLWFGVVRLYSEQSRVRLGIGGLLTVVVGHVGGIAGAIYVGTLGVALCYTAGIWALFLAVKGVRTTREGGS